MQRLIYCGLFLTVLACNKPDPDLPKYVSKSMPVFPLREGNIWQRTVTEYYLDGTTMSEITEMDTVGNSKMIDGIMFFEFAGNFYHEVDKSSIEIEGDRSGQGLEKKYVYYRYADGIDTLWKTVHSGNTYSGDTLYCIAYPYDSVINGLKCRRTEMRAYVYHDILPYVSEKRVSYFAPGKGPVRELFFINSGSQLLKIKEINYTPVLTSF